MEIGRKNGSPWLRRLLGVGLLVLAFGAGLLLGQEIDWAQMAQSWQGTAAQLRAESGSLPALGVDMSFADYDTLLAQRSEALEQGVFIGAASDFVNADLMWEGETIPVRVRLQQGTAVHLGEDEKWNLEVRTRGDARLLDMTRFYLIDPADNHWLNEWAFLETVRREGLSAGRYHFVRLRFNGEDWGVYAVQEGFAPPLLAANGRPQGVIVEFDPTPLWESIRYYEGDAAAALADPVTNLSAEDFQFFAVDAFRDTAVGQDAALSAQREAAIGLLRGLQNGSLPASAVFDVAAYGRFLALVDLWGAAGATRLTNLRYYYHPETNRLTPIPFNGRPAADGRISLAATYHDPALQLAYADAAARYSDPVFLTALQADLEPAWTALQAALGGEMTAVPPWETLAARQAQMRRSLSPVQPAFAYLGDFTPTAAAIPIDIANTLNLPLEMVGFDVDGVTFLEADPAWLAETSAGLLAPGLDGVVLGAHSGEATAVLRYARFHIPLTAVAGDAEWTGLAEPTIRVATRIPGSETVQWTTAQPGYPPPLAAPLQ